jgi:DNA polymerase-3 subunit beta
MTDTDLMSDPDLEEDTEETEEEGFVPSNADLAFETKRFVFLNQLERAASVLPSKDIMPVLKNFQVEVEAGRLRVIATDLQLSVMAETEMVSTQRPGSAVFPGKRLLEIMKQADGDDMALDVSEGKARIKIGRTTWDLMLMDGSEYPPLPDTDEVDFAPVDRAKFLSAISAVRYAAATDTVRPSLMLIDITDNKMRAADGVRLQQVPVDFPLDAQIPIGAVDDLVKLLRTTDQNTIEVGETENNLVFRIATDVFIAQKLTAQFPDVEAMILRPALGNDKELNVDREDLIAAIRRVRVTADEETNAVIINLSKGKAEISARDKYGNFATEPLDARWDHADTMIGLNHKHLVEMLSMTDVKSCSFFLGKDIGTSRRAPLMLKDNETGQVGILNQLRVEFL